MKAFVFGSGKVGSCVARGLRGAGWSVDLRSARRGLPHRLEVDVVIVATRDDQIAAAARDLAKVVGTEAVVLHVAGSLGPEALGALRGKCKGVGQIHPMLSFADRRRAPTLAGAFAHVSGDRPAVAMARKVARALGMKPRTMAGMDLGAYHAAGGLVASGTIALVQAGIEVLEAWGVEPGQAVRMLGPLLRSVAENLEALGLPGALTGVVRRGDVVRAQAHLRAIREAAPAHVALYRGVLRAQLPLASALGEADRGDLERLGRLAASARSGGRAGRSSIRGR